MVMALGLRVKQPLYVNRPYVSCEKWCSCLIGPLFIFFIFFVSDLSGSATYTNNIPQKFMTWTIYQESNV